MAKVSKQKQEEIRQEIILTAVDMFGEKGFEATTMKQIARAVGIGDATIYKYFSNKDKLIFAYYQLKAQNAVDEFKQEPDLDSYSLQEKLQLLIDIYLNNLLADREFVSDSMEMIMQSPSILFKDVTPIREEFIALIHELLIEAEKSGEIAESPFTGIIAKLANEFILAVLLYWIKDDSDEFSNTTQLVDLTLSLAVEILKSGIVGKASDLISFFLKAHLYKFVGGGLLNKVLANKTFSFK